MVALLPAIEINEYPHGSQQEGESPIDNPNTHFGLPHGSNHQIVATVTKYKTVPINSRLR